MKHLFFRLVVLALAICSVTQNSAKADSTYDANGCCSAIDANADPIAASVCTAIDGLPVNAVTTVQIKFDKCMTVPKDGMPGPGPGFVHGCGWFASTDVRCRSNEPVEEPEGCCISNEWPWVNPVCEAVDNLTVPPSTWSFKQSQCLGANGQCVWAPSADERCRRSEPPTTVSTHEAPHSSGRVVPDVVPMKTLPKKPGLSPDSAPSLMRGFFSN